MADDLFKDNLSAYRLAVSLAIHKRIDIKEHQVNRGASHMYLISQVDPDGIFSNVIETLFPEYKNQKYRALEKFADLGMLKLKDEIDKNNGSLVFWE